MPTTLTDSVTWATSISAPASGDLRRALTVETPLQQLANRTAYLKDQTEVTGVKRIQYVADFSAAAALTGLTDGDLVLIGRYGLYIYGNTVSLTSPWQIACGTKYLIHTLASLIIAMTDGLVGTNSSGDLARPDIVPYRTVIQSGVSVGTDASASYQSVSGDAAWHAVTNGVTAMSVNLGPAAAGDIVVVNAIGAFGCGADPAVSPMNQGLVRVRVTPAAGSATSVAGGCAQFQSDTEGEYLPWAISCRHVLSASEGTNVNVKLEACVTAADMAMVLASPISLQCQIIRP
jgi:hypothetical protein